MMRVVYLILACILSGVSLAQPTTQPTQPLGGKVALLFTFGPGEAVYERWGHNAIVIVDLATREQAAYHYGVFDFDQPNFIGRFILGRMLYSMGVIRGDEVDGMIASYIQADRDTWMQRLDFTPAQIDRLQQYLEDNFKPENRDYLYDYFRANCSTKVRDALDHAADGELRRQWAGVQTDSTFRREARIGAADFPFIHAGFSFALSARTDQPNSLWDKAFVPMHLREQLSRMIINGRPIILVEERLHTSKHLPVRTQPPQWIGYFLLAGGVIGGTMLLCGMRFPRSKWGDRVFLVTGMTWSLVAGLGGIFLVFAWFFTNHAAAHANQNLLLCSPVSLLMLVLLPAHLKGRPRGKWALPVAGVIVLLAILSLAMKILPVSQQWNWEIIALALPAHLGLMLALARPRRNDLKGNV